MKEPEVLLLGNKVPLNDVGDGVKLMKGNYYYQNKRRKVRKKTIVFDLDETIGHFKHLKQLYQCIHSTSQQEFNTLLDLYPEFLRPGIMSIFELLAEKKRSGDLCKLLIYTNNQYEANWVHNIVNYIETKLKYKGLFDDIIKAFKQNNKVIEIRRTTRSKTYMDYISCLMLPEDTVETCFIDDKHYDRMCGDKVYYILPKAYYHRMSKMGIVKRIMSPASPFKYYPELEYRLMEALTENMHKGNYVSRLDASKELEKELAVTKKIMYLVREYLYYPKLPVINKTRRALTTTKNQSRKNKDL